jgi:hypothetical protein
MFFSTRKRPSTIDGNNWVMIHERRHDTIADSVKGFHAGRH